MEARPPVVRFFSRQIAKSPAHPMSSSRSFAFGRFTLVPERQLLLCGGNAVRIGCRAFDLLSALVERPGELITKAELMARAWPSTVVEETNLKVNMLALRRALGDGARTPHYIATVMGRGYRFIAPVHTNDVAGRFDGMTREGVWVVVIHSFLSGARQLHSIMETHDLNVAAGHLRFVTCKPQACDSSKVEDSAEGSLGGNC